jgi:hypothetical protein
MENSEAMTTNPNETLQAVNQACRDLCRAMESAQDQHGASSREAREAEAAYDLATECRARLERRFGW